jgi:hypothetical protein
MTNLVGNHRVEFGAGQHFRRTRADNNSSTTARHEVCQGVRVLQQTDPFEMNRRLCDEVYHGSLPKAELRYPPPRNDESAEHEYEEIKCY